ncbi:MAG TPA: hypothetical protein VFX86_03220 [Candidatus Saccharimonadales bacterium]|nr:hypothetical protein [Candidatus Saccharimonadales bacterium]
MPDKSGEKLVRDERKRGTSMTWPVVVHDKLDELVYAANEEGVKTTRQELVGVIIGLTVPDGETLAEQVMTFRKAKVTDILPE